MGRRLTDEDVRILRELRQWQQRFTVRGCATFSNTPKGPMLYIPPQGVGRRGSDVEVQRAKVTNDDPGTDSVVLAKHYNGTETVGPEFPVYTTGAPANDADIVVVRPAGGTPGTYDGEPVRWREVQGGGGAGLFPVTVEKTGGDQGTQTSAATYTYSVWDAITGELLGTGVPVSKPRDKGRVTHQDPGGYGTAFYNALGSLVLWDAGEKYGTNGCATS